MSTPVSEGIRTDYAVAMQVKADELQAELDAMLETSAGDSGPITAGVIMDPMAVQRRGTIAAQRVEVERFRRQARDAAADSRIVVVQGDMMDATWRTHPATKRWLPAARDAGLIKYRP
jgi:hypothetical protein